MNVSWLIEVLIPDDDEEHEDAEQETEDNHDTDNDERDDINPEL